MKMYGLSTKREVSQKGRILTKFFFACLWTKPLSSYPIYYMEKEHIFLRDTASNPERAR